MPSPFESTPVPIVNGRPDWNAVMPENCQPPSTCLRTPDFGPGISHR